MDKETIKNKHSYSVLEEIFQQQNCIVIAKKLLQHISNALYKFVTKVF